MQTEGKMQTAVTRCMLKKRVVCSLYFTPWSDVLSQGMDVLKKGGREKRMEGEERVSNSLVNPPL